MDSVVVSGFGAAVGLGMPCWALAEGAKTVDVEKRKAAYKKMQEVTRKDLPYLPIFQYAMVSGVKGKLEGFAPNVNVQENCWNANTWFWSA